MDLNISKILELYEKEKVITKVAQEYAKTHNIEYTDAFRRKVSHAISKSNNGTEITNTNSDVEDSASTTDSNDYASSIKVNLPSAWDAILNRHLDIEEYCTKYNLPYEMVRSYKLITHNATHMVYNIVFRSNEELEQHQEILEAIDRIIPKILDSDVTKSNLKSKSTPVQEEIIDRLVYTDVHIGMDTSGTNGTPMYDGLTWNKEQVEKRLEIMEKHVLKYKKSDTLYIDDLGDFMDGLDGQTVRKGHELPQNMSTEEAFELGVSFKVTLAASLSKFYKKIICHNVTNDNHSGEFSIMVNYAAQKILEVKVPSIEFSIQKKFIDHYKVGNRTFILCHGKDMGEMKFGFKPFLDAVQAAKIDAYMKENRLFDGNHVEFSKGDSHQSIFDDTTSNDFMYYNYPAFSPPSNWVQTNFKKTKSGFMFFNISTVSNESSVHPYFFKQ